MEKKNELAVKFGKVLKEERLKNKLSQETLAYNAGFERAYISLLERGLRQPTITTIFKLARQLKIAPEVLVKKVNDIK